MNVWRRPVVVVTRGARVGAWGEGTGCGREPMGVGDGGRVAVVGVPAIVTPVPVNWIWWGPDVSSPVIAQDPAAVGPVVVGVNATVSVIV